MTMEMMILEKFYLERFRKIMGLMDRSVESQKVEIRDNGMRQKEKMRCTSTVD